jgi:Tol biopolymer transport system component/class 3 adenylate cyclase
MPDEAPAPATSTAPPLEIAHILFLDIVGFSKLPLNQQNRAVELLQSAVRASRTSEQAVAEGHLVRIPTGDGAALAFFREPTAPVRAALEIAEFAAANPDLRLRMGVHSGPVYVVEDMNGHKNVTGSGINIAQRVMDCGDAGHILVSQAVAELLNQLDEWSGSLEFLGEAQVKHEVLLPVYKLTRNGVGNDTWPSKLTALRQRRTPDPLTRPLAQQQRWRLSFGGSRRILIAGSVLLALVAAALTLVLVVRSRFSPQPFSSFTASKLTDSGTVGFAVAISPDGKYLVYSEFQPNGLTVLRLKHLASGHVTEVLPPQPREIYSVDFTPEGTYIAFLSGEPLRSPDEFGRGIVYEVPVVGGTPRELVRNVLWGVSFSPDGKHLAYLRTGTTGGSLLIANRDGSGEATIAHPVSSNDRPAWSPDSSTIAIARNWSSSGSSESRPGIELHPFAGGKPRLLPSPEILGAPVWLPNGSGLIALMRGQIWFLPLPSGPLRRITNDLNFYSTLSITTDSRTLVSAQQQVFGTIWVMPADGNGPAVQVPTGKSSGFVGWTSTGELLLHARYSIFRIKPDGSGYVTVLEQKNAITAAEACGTGSIRFNSGDHWTVEQDGSNLRKNSSDVCLPDGKWGHVLPSKYSLSLESNSGDTRKAVYRTKISSDGRYILYVRGEGKAGMAVKIFATVAPLHGDATVSEVELVGCNPYSDVKWTPDGKAFAYIRFDERELNLWVQPLAGGPPRRLTNFTSDFINSFGWSPDGQHLVVASSKRQRDIVTFTQSQ